ncbi:hypothetical protein ExPCM14_03132 [Escherichia coli]|nr:hypothetical protein ExPCM14_03132 [Escherichia coli]
MWLGSFQQLRQRQFLLFGGETVQLFQQVGATNQIHQTRYPQLCHQLAGFTCDKLKVISHLERQAVIVILTQFVILSCYTRGAVVQVANTQIFTAERHHRASAEAEAFCAENRRFDDINAGFQAAINLQTDLMTQTIGNQRLLGFNKPQLPRTACVFHR